MNFRLISYLLLVIISFLACTTKLPKTDRELKKQIFNSLYQSIQDSLRYKIAIGDTFYVNPVMKIHRSSCSTYGYTNRMIEECIKKEVSKEKWRSFDAFAYHLDTKDYWDLQNYTDRELPVIFENRINQSLNFSPILKLNKNQYKIIAYIDIGYHDELAYFFYFKKVNDLYKLSSYYSIDDCIYYRTQNDYLSDYWNVKDTLQY
jgi:hypothetical protein